MKNCIFCGEEITDGKFCGKHSNKKMCINCKYSECTEEGEYLCINEHNKECAKKRALEAVSNAVGPYKIENFDLDITPVALKKPLLKCGEWEIRQEVIEEFISSFQ